MIFKKISAAFSLIISLLLYVHLFFSIAYAKFYAADVNVVKGFAWTLFILSCIHIIMSVITFFGFKGKDHLKKGEVFKFQTILQIVSACVVFLLLFFHVFLPLDYISDNLNIDIIFSSIFIICALMHNAFSIGKALKNVGVIDKVMIVKRVTNTLFVINAIIATASICSVIGIVSI